MSRFLTSYHRYCRALRCGKRSGATLSAALTSSDTPAGAEEKESAISGAKGDLTKLRSPLPSLPS